VSLLWSHGNKKNLQMPIDQYSLLSPCSLLHPLNTVSCNRLMKVPVTLMQLASRGSWDIVGYITFFGAHLLFYSAVHREK
jgi:hypothetical protein